MLLFMVDIPRKVQKIDRVACRIRCGKERPMKKIVVLVMVLALAFPLSACSKNQDINQNLMEQVQLDDAEMKDALVELTERLPARCV